jgi:hypothetical protein
LIERHDRTLRRDLLRETIDEMHFGADGPDGADRTLFTVLMMYSVLPLSSAAWTTSHGTSGERSRGCPDAASQRVDLRRGKANVDRAVPLPQDHPRALHVLGSRPPKISFGSQTTISSSGMPIL